MARDDNKAHAGHKRTSSVCNTYCVSSATVVWQTYHNDACTLSCYLWNVCCCPRDMITSRWFAPFLLPSGVGLIFQMAPIWFLSLDYVEEQKVIWLVPYCSVLQMRFQLMPYMHSEWLENCQSYGPKYVTLSSMQTDVCVYSYRNCSGLCTLHCGLEVNNL